MALKFPAGGPAADDLVEVKAGPGLGRYRPAVVVCASERVITVRALFSKAGPMEVQRQHARPLDAIRESELRRLVLGVGVATDGKARPIVADGEFHDAAHVSPLRAVPPRVQPWRSPRFKAFVRRQPCCAPDEAHQGRVQAHHEGPHPTGQKASDDHCVPLCAAHHQQIHDHARFAGLTVEQSREHLRAKRNELRARWERGER